MSATVTFEVRVPDIGDFKDIPVIELLVKPGDVVALDQPIVTLESDKATLDVPAPRAGRVATLAVQPGTRVSVGSLLLTMHSATGDPSGPSLAPGLPITVAASVAATPVAPTDFAAAEIGGTLQMSSNVVSIAASSHNEAAAISRSTPSSRIYASPSIRRLGRQLGSDLEKVKGSGRGGRILLEDVHNSVREALKSSASSALGSPAIAPAAKIDFSKFGEIERKPLSRIQRISGPALARNWATIPHVTNFDEADVTELESFRVSLNQELGGDPKVTMLSFLVKAVGVTLKSQPTFNASLDEQDLILKKYVNVGVAVDSADGLVVPVVRNADTLGIVEIARALTARSAAARSGKLRSSDLEGGNFTISSLGGIGGTGFTPIINSPEIAILGVTKATIQPRWDGAEFKPRLILPLALSWDHRATDGVAAARFLVQLVRLLQDFRRVLL
jgi:pyruvate dehydrogenase E2 component (dihydrolipoamide acetyltransferase)